jgi:hypothetical protein
MRLLQIAAFACCCGLLASPLAAQSAPIVPEQPMPLQSGSGGEELNSKQWMSFLGPESSTVPASKPTTLTLRFHIADGFHINSHTPLSKLLIPTQLIVIEQQGLRVTGVDFPAGQPYAFSFDPSNKLDVYSGDIAITARLRATPGTHIFGAKLRYQACDHAACYPPKLLPVKVTLTAK